MIPYDAVTAWGVGHPWPTREQVEQGLDVAQRGAGDLRVGGDGDADGREVLDGVHGGVSRYGQRRDNRHRGCPGIGAVSYTHLTLPTSDLV